VRKKFKDVETKYHEERNSFFSGLLNADRRTFFKYMSLSGGIALAKSLVAPHSFQLIEVAMGAEGPSLKSSKNMPEVKGNAPFTFAYISDTHLYERKLNDRFVKAALRAVDDVNRLDPQPDFVFFGGDLAQLGQKAELKLGYEILKEVKAPLHVMVGEHDWYLDLGETWRELFGEPTYSFDHKGVHCVVLNSVIEKDFWTEKKLTPQQRMQIVAGLDDGRQSRFEVGAPQRDWLKADLAKYSDSTPIIVFSHSPLYKYYRDWNFWTEDADEVQAILKRFDTVTVIHGHTHQLLLNQINNISFYGLLSTAWPWPYAPEGLPKLTVQMNRANPFSESDGCGDGKFLVKPENSGSKIVTVDKLYNLWDRRPVNVTRNYLKTKGSNANEKPLETTLPSF
jgi:3',5'-cyclic-AMP phosphodiesterase